MSEVLEMSRAAVVKEVERSWGLGCGRGGEGVGQWRELWVEERRETGEPWQTYYGVSPDPIQQHREAKWYSPFGAQLGSYL